MMPIVKNNKHTLIFLAIAIIAILFFLMFESYFPRPGAGPVCEQSYQQKAIDMFINLISQIMSWSLAIIGGTAFYLKWNIDSQNISKYHRIYMTETVILLSILSIYFGHILITNLIIATSENNFALKDWSILLLMRLQYGSFILSILVFGFIVHKTFSTITTEGGK